MEAKALVTTPPGRLYRVRPVKSEGEGAEGRSLMSAEWSVLVGLLQIHALQPCLTLSQTQRRVLLVLNRFCMILDI